MPEQPAEERGAISAKSPAATRLEEALREAERCLHVPGPALRARLSGQHRHSRLHPEDHREELPRRLRRHHRHQSAAAGLRPGLSAGERSAKASARSATSLEPVAIGRLERFVGDMAIAEGWANVPYIEPNGLRIGIVGSGPGRHGLRRRHGQGRLRCHRLRGVPRGRRRAEIRHSRIPPAQRRGRRRDRQADQARHQIRVQHAGRTPVHHRADDHRNGLSTPCSSASAPAIRASWAFLANRSTACCRPTNCSPAAI